MPGPGPHDDISCNAWSDVIMYFCIRQPTIQIYDGIDIPSLERDRTDVVNNVCLYEFSWSCWLWSSWVVWTDTVLPRSVKGMVAPQNTPDTTEANLVPSSVVR